MDRTENTSPNSSSIVASRSYRMDRLENTASQLLHCCLLRIWCGHYLATDVVYRAITEQLLLCSCLFRGRWLAFGLSAIICMLCRTVLNASISIFLCTVMSSLNADKAVADRKLAVSYYVDYRYHGLESNLQFTWFYVVLTGNNHAHSSNMASLEVCHKAASLNNKLAKSRGRWVYLTYRCLNSIQGLLLPLKWG
jgi:hypothetical protein